MKTIEELKSIVRKENERLLHFYGVDMTTDYGAYAAKYSKPENIKACREAGVDMTTEYGAYIARCFTKEMIESEFSVEEMTLTDVCKELGRKIKIVK